MTPVAVVVAVLEGNLVPIKRVHLLFLFLAWVVIFPPRAFAYLDPGTGSLIVQSVIAGVAAVGFAVRLYWSRIRSWFTRSGDSTELPSDNPNGRNPER